MTEYIVTFDGPNNSAEIRGKLIRCAECLNYCTEDGMPWCAVHFTPITDDGFCDSGEPKEEGE
jgi:hypothetical protein